MQQAPVALLALLMVRPSAMGLLSLVFATGEVSYSSQWPREPNVLMERLLPLSSDKADDQS